MKIEGLDFSKWQGRITREIVEALVANNIEVVGIRTSQGSDYKDPEAENTARLLREYGILIFPYHFTTNHNAGDQFRWYLKCMDFIDWDLPPALDCEAFNQAGGMTFGERELLYYPQARYEFARLALAEDGIKLGYTPDGTAYAAWQTWGLSYPSEQIIDAIGRQLTLWMATKPWIAKYVYPTIYTNCGSGNRIFKTASMSRYSLWVASWPKAGDPPLDKPACIPAVWKNKNYIYHQNGVIDGSIYKINGKVDHNLWGNLFPFPGDIEPQPKDVIKCTLEYPNGDIWIGDVERV